MSPLLARPSSSFLLQKSTLRILLCLSLYIVLAGPPCAKAEQLQTGMSPGPTEYSIPVTWLTHPGHYGPGDYAVWLTIDGLKRYYEVHVPPQYNPQTPTPVVLNLHGGGGNPDIARYDTQMDGVADKNGFIVVYPAGTGAVSVGIGLYWNSGPLRKYAALQNIDDVGFISAVLDSVESLFTIDTARVYATGMSNGGQMAFRLGAQLSNRIAAIGPVSGDRTIGMFFEAPPRPVPVIYFHGLLDTWLPFKGGPQQPESLSAFEPVQRPPVPSTVAGWVQQAGENPTIVERTVIGQAVHYHFPASNNQNADADFWVLQNGGHTWPGGNATKDEVLLGVGTINQDISASALLWDFFKGYTLSN